MEKKLLEYNLQLFAEEVQGEEVSEVAEQTDVDESTESDVEENAEESTGDEQPTKQSDEENARYASIRRKAEEDARRKYEAEISRQNAERDAAYAEMCKGINHPVTGKPITTEAEYRDALIQQKRIETEAEFREKGIDPNVINQMIESNPLVMQAKQVIEKSKADEAQMQLQRDLEEITKIDPNIKGMEDIANLPNCGEIIARVENGASLVDAYKAANFDAILRNQSASARQQAINEIRGKSHLNTPNGVAQTDDSVDVPLDILNRWKSEGKSEKQIKELYNTVIKKLGGK